MSFDAFGLRRDASNWDYDLSQNTIATLKNYTDRGFTDQEQLDNLSLVDMNGRVYDPTVGRMISADPTVPDAFFSQAFNRFAYVDDSPLEYTDPSGYDKLAVIVVNCNWWCQYLALMQGSNMFAAYWYYQLVSSPPVVPPGVGGHGGPGSHGSAKPPTNSTQPQQPTQSQTSSTAKCMKQAAAFVSANTTYADEIQQQTSISATNLLGLAALESNFGTSNLATTYNNYFGLTVGPAYKGTVGTYSVLTTGYTFGVYPSPGFLTSGFSFAQSFQGARVAGIDNSLAFAKALTTPPQAFNSEPGYAGKLVARINQVTACQ